MQGDETAWEEILEFTSPDEFRRFSAFIESAVGSGRLEEIPADSSRAIGPFGERWYRDLVGRTWRLTEPDFPYKGAFKLIEPR
ncbi:hypothetical protein ACIA8O_14375 [Kitasatospora sp. NPDC051853]|uniref:hypothetical protein n=1 Tax=Kitasatospora sp. NPDC051853 TaxID=3364058 RepID=UPI0037A64D3B